MLNKKNVVLFSTVAVAAAIAVFFCFWLNRQTAFLVFDEVAGDVRLVGAGGGARPLVPVPVPGAAIDADCRLELAAGARVTVSVLDRGQARLDGPAIVRFYKSRTDWWRLEEGRMFFLSESVGHSEARVRERALGLHLWLDRDRLVAGSVVGLRLRLDAPSAVVRAGGSLADRKLYFLPEADRPAGDPVWGGGGLVRREQARQTVEFLVRSLPGYAAFRAFVTPKNSPDLLALAGLDCQERGPETRLAVWAFDRAGCFAMRAWRVPLVKFAQDRRGTRFLAAVARPFPASAYAAAPPDWLARWEQKKKDILADGKPQKEAARLQRVFTNASSALLPLPSALRLPLAGHDRVSSPYGVVRYLTATNGVAHRGIDFAAPEGVTTLAALPGRVVFAAETGVHGGLVIVDHGRGVFTSCLHQSRILVRSNDQVAAGDPLGRVGTTGLSTGPHLHYEVRVGNVAVDPTPWFVRVPVIAEPLWRPLPN